MKPLTAARLRERRERDARRGRLGKGRFESMAKELAGVMQMAFEAGVTGSKFGLEGPLRHEIRAELCLSGWGWSDANTMAVELLEEAFALMRAQRPSWKEGQREWTVEAGTLIERTHCAHCLKPLPDGRPKFCSDLCMSAHHHQINYRKEASEERALDLAIRSI